MNVNQEIYNNKVKNFSPRSKLIKNCFAAFTVGGFICGLGEILSHFYIFAGLNEKDASTCVCITFIILTGILTGIGIFDTVAKIAGAGTMVPITGFANAVVSPAIEFQTEGRITGTAVKMFTIAGPVIVFGCSSASLYGLIYYFFIRG